MPTSQANLLHSGLPEETRSRLRRLAGTDIVVGVPSYKNTRTIGNVVASVGLGLGEHFRASDAVILISDGGSTDDTAELALRAELPDRVSRVVTEYQGTTGKGSAIRAILEAADIVGAKACAIIDADVRSITPGWVERLVAPILSAKADFVTPVYSRDRHEVTINDMIAYPLTRALYGRDIRQPLGGEIAMSPRAWRLYLNKDVWETDVARFGVHIWMTTLAINGGWRLYQAPLGTKTHDYKDPTIGFEPKFMQIVGTLFRLMQMNRRVWPDIGAAQPVPLWGDLDRLDPEPVPTTRQTLRDGFKKGARRYRKNLAQILNADQQHLVEQLLEEGSTTPFPADDWARLVCDFAVAYNRGEGDPDKVALSLLPLYYARKASMLSQLEGKPWTAVEDAIAKQAAAFEQHKDYLIDRWVSYLPWQAPVR